MRELMVKREDKNTRYFLDIDLQKQRIIRWDYDQKDKLQKEEISNPKIHRIYLSKGQYNKMKIKLEDYQPEI
mgnify:CR=1 FL=1